MDWLTLARDVGIPASGAVTGWVGAAVRTHQRLKALEDSFANYKKEISEQFTKVQQAWRLELTDFKQELLDKFKDLKQQVEELEDNLNTFQRASSHDFAKDSELARFVEDQQRQWQSIQRTLGQIEGMMRTLK